MFCKKGVLENFAKFTGKNTCVRVSFLIKLQASGLQLIKKETLVQVFTCGFCEIFKNAYFYRTLPVAASVSIYTFPLEQIREDFMKASLQNSENKFRLLS